ncbi:hypothetical protein ABT120_48740 [Nonomuraea angiospora]|uniref:hypothetical protein n=1 Tax=Nonomuraea angiospora TaxID=46172 RepID=UPI00332681C8
MNELFQRWRIFGPAIVELAFEGMSADERRHKLGDHARRMRAVARGADAGLLVEEASHMWTWLPTPPATVTSYGSTPAS